MTLTASAPPHVEVELVKSLHMQKTVYIRQPLDRPNTFYAVYKTSMAVRVARVGNFIYNDYCNTYAAWFWYNSQLFINSGWPQYFTKIIFFGTKGRTVKAYCYLQSATVFPHYVGAYYADLTQHLKHFVLQQFMSSSSEIRCVLPLHLDGNSVILINPKSMSI